MMATIQAKMDSRGMGQGLVLNGMDNLPTAAAHVATGAVANMFDHWTILQFINETTGVMDATAMDDGFKMGACKQQIQAHQALTCAFPSIWMHFVVAQFSAVEADR